MIDTLKIILDDSYISSKNNLIIIPASIEINSGLLLNNYFLFKDSLGTIYEGSRAIYNDEKINLTILNKYSLVAENQNRDLNWNSYDEGNTKIFLQISLPKFFKGNNFKPTDLYNLKSDLKKIEKYLKEKVGIYTNILNATISRLDTFLNLKTKYTFKTYNEILSNLKLSRYKNFEYAGTTFLYKNTQAQICIYDKREEMKNQDIELKYSGNFVRIENRLLKKKKILDSLGYVEVSKMPDNLSIIKETYKNNIETKIFRDEGKEVIDKNVLAKENLLSYLQDLKKEKGNRFFNHFIKTVGYLYLNDFNKLKNLEDSIKEIANNKMQLSRFNRTMSDLNFHSILFKEQNNVKNKDLYFELKEKFNNELEKIDL